MEIKKIDKKKRISFSQRLFWSVFSIFLGFTVCFLLFQYQREKELAQEKLNTLLNNYNYQLFNRCKEVTDIAHTIEVFITEIPQNDLRVTMISPSGKVVYDNSGTDNFDNHISRSEVQKALSGSDSYAIRNSESTGQKYFYSASYINGYIYRTALPYNQNLKAILAANMDFVHFMAFMILVFFFVLSRFTFSIGQTVSKLRDFALHVEKGDIQDTNYDFPSDELGEIAQNMVVLYNQQQKAKDELAMEREKLFKHFQYAKEGFSMFTPDRKEILSNNLFIQFVNVISDIPINQVEDAIEIPEFKPILSFLSKDKKEKGSNKKVLRESLTIDKKGNIFLIECLLFLDDSFEISINDISRQEEESRMKRQLTQNVAHELKTPVSSIQGYLETILANEELPPEKQQFFLDRCYSQSTRLVGLLRDISVLNRIDEATNMFDLSSIQIGKLLEEIEKECSKEMEEKQITSTVILPNTPVIYGNYSLLYSIFRNLYDNTIAYAGEGCKITVNCYREDATFYYFRYADNGTGISEEHINRIFERFYRVDKGRSRKMGGTGLGLSIVKNAVLFHKGKISAKSSLGNGITFFFTLKKKL